MSGVETMKAEQNCGAVYKEHVCERELGHSGKHRVGGVSWTDGGAARVQKELEHKKILSASVGE